LVVGNVAAADLEGTWEAYSECYGVNEDPGENPEDPTIEPGTSLVEFNQDGDFIWTKNVDNGQYCYGVIDGNKISLTCPGDSFGYGTIKGKTIYYISHVLADGKTCRITVTPYVEVDPD
jgi:hypothetical protein